MTHRLILSYDGRAYAGWQRQQNAVTVQQRVEEALAEIFDLEGRMVIHGAGRTDAGVHARGQVAHFKSPRENPGRALRRFPVKGLVHATNYRLPPDIRAVGADWMPDGFHAQKSAVAKSYVYRLLNTRVASPLDAAQAMVVPRPLDERAVRLALDALPGRHDFSAFANAGGSHRQPWRRLFAAHLEVRNERWQLRFIGQGFLRGMVRSLVGTLVEIGRGERPASDMARLLEPGRRRQDAGFTAEAQGLCLERVFYDPTLKPLESYRPGPAPAPCLW